MQFNVWHFLFNYFLMRPRLQILSIASAFHAQTIKAGPATIAATGCWRALTRSEEPTNVNVRYTVALINKRNYYLPPTE